MQKTEKAFLDFYQQEQIIPVTQNVEQLDAHFARREALYRTCGIPSGFLKDRTILEVGPGTGHNALFTYSLQPKKYVLVDGHSLSIQATDQNLKATFGQHQAHLIESDFWDFETSEQFDVVLCEGTIPFQHDPERFAKKLCRFVAENGVLLVTTVSATSFLSELLRRILAGMLLQQASLSQVSTHEKLSVLSPFFDVHLKTLPAMTRKVDDWVLDNILHPYTGKLWSIKDAVIGLADDMLPYQSSPHFVTDWRWYKAIDNDRNKEKERFIISYESNALNFLDYRHIYPEISPDLGRQIEQVALDIYQLSQQNMSTDWYQEMTLAPLLMQLLKILPEQSAQPIIIGIEEMLLAFQKFQAKKSDWADSLDSFTGWFGRGMNYVSFIKKSSKV